MANIKGIMQQHGGNPDDAAYWEKYSDMPEEQFLASDAFTNMTGKAPIGTYTPPAQETAPAPLLSSAPVDTASGGSETLAEGQIPSPTSPSLKDVKPYVPPTPAEPVPEYKAPTPYTPAEENTVAGRMKGLLSSGSDYMSSAKQRAVEMMAKRGGINTTMAATAGEKAAIEAALPIAQQDAASFQEAGIEGYKGALAGAQNIQKGGAVANLSTQEARQTAALTVLEADLASGMSMQESLQKMAEATHSGAIASGLSRQEALQELSRATHAGAIASGLSAQEATQVAGLEVIRQEGLDFRLDQELTSTETMKGWDLDHDTMTAAGDRISGLGDSYSKQINLIQADPNLSPEAKTEAMGRLKSIYEANMGVVTSVYGTPLTWTEEEIEAYVPPDPTVDTEAADRLDALEKRINELLAQNNTGLLNQGGPPGAAQGADGLDYGGAFGSDADPSSGVLGAPY